MARLTARFRASGIAADDRPALEAAVEDFAALWRRTFGDGTFSWDGAGSWAVHAGAAPAAAADVEILAGTGEPFAEGAELLRRGAITAGRPAPEGFMLDVVALEGRRVAVLRAADRLGIQYAVYALAEVLLGARYPHPFFDLLPPAPPLPEEVHRVEKPAMAVRMLYETSHTADDLRATTRRISHYSDVGAWRWEDWAGNPERVRRLVVWAVKNGANTLFFDDSIFVQMKDTYPGIVSEPVWRTIDLRGLKTFQYVGPSWGQRPGPAYAAGDFCTHAGPRVGGWAPGMDPKDPKFWDDPANVTRLWSKHLCIERGGFWRDQRDWLRIAAPHAHRLVGLAANWNENPCGEGAVEAGSTGSPDPLSNELGPSRIERPALSSGSGCAACGRLRNVDKWNRLLDWHNGPEGAPALGLPPVGIVRTHWSIASPDDTLVAEAVVPHLPDGSFSPIYCLPSCNHAERVEAWPRIADRLNAADGRARRVFLVRELNYGCQGDMPIAHVSSLDRIDDDLAVFGRYRSTATVVGGCYTLHSLGWLLTLRSMRAQWTGAAGWQAWLEQFLAGVLGAREAALVADLASRLRDIELLDGFEPGEYASYYSLWGLNLGKLGHERLPVDGALRAVLADGRPKHVRLVARGAAGPTGLYTPRRCAPAARRIRDLLKRLERADRDLDRIERAAARSPERAFWLEHLVAPLRWTVRFLSARLALAGSYVRYVEARAAAAKGGDPAGALAEGASLCRRALEEQERYVLMRPGFGADYPQEMCADTLHVLSRRWRELADDPTRLAGADVCAFLDAAEEEVEAPAR